MDSNTKSNKQTTEVDKSNNQTINDNKSNSQTINDNNDLEKEVIVIPREERINTDKSNNQTIEDKNDPEKEVIVIPREERTLVDNDEEENSAQDVKHVFFRRIIITPLRGFADILDNELNRSNNDTIKPNSLSGGELPEIIESKNRKHSKNEKHSKNTKHVKIENTHMPYMHNSKNDKHIKIENISSNILHRCYALMSVLVILISMISFVVYKLHHEIIRYKQVKSIFTA